MYCILYICTRPCHPPLPPPYGMGPIYWSHMRSSPSPPVVWWGCGTVPLPPPVVWWMGPIYWSHMRSSPSPPVVWWGCGTVPLPPCGVVDGSHILVPYEIFPLPPLWCGGGEALSPSPPVVWWGCGMVWWVCMVCMVGLVWHVWKVWYVWYVW